MDAVVNQFFAPVQTDLIDNLLARYQQEKNKIVSVSEVLLNTEGLNSTFSYFVKGNLPPAQQFFVSTSLFDSKGALKYLDARYWQEVMNLTKVNDLMPQKRRKEWSDQIESGNTPVFDDGNVRSTIMTLLNSRKQFVAEKVDGIFYNLSSSHVTNCPEGFSKRMIIARIMDKYESVNTERVGYIDDLRSVLLKIIKLNEEFHGNTYDVLKNIIKLNAFGQWFDIDSGALKIKLFKAGTVHIEVHPDVAISLNEILSFLYPMAIPEKYKTRSKQSVKEFVLKDNLIPMRLLNLLGDLKTPPLKRNRPVYAKKEGWTDNENSLYLHSRHSKDKKTLDELDELLAFIGACKHQINQAVWYEFDYDAKDIISSLILKGVYPDFKSYQYYPTENELSELAFIEADVNENDECLEPSAGQGSIAKYLPKKTTLCVEISDLNVDILKKKGFNTVHQDFLKWSDKNLSKKFDKIVMNPPFSKNRAVLHVKTALKHLKEQGKLVAIIPSTYKNKELVEGYNHTYSCEYKEMFEGTQVSVVLVTIEK